MSKPVITLIEHPGSRKNRVAGVGLTLKAGDSAEGPTATWAALVSSLQGFVPRAGDELRAGDGSWWTVQSVGAVANDAYPCLCAKEVQS